MLCNLCRLEKTLIRAHIIAECLLKPLFSPVRPILSIPKDVSAYPRRLPIGVYDTNILCAACDNLLSPWERYTANLLFERAPMYRSLAKNGFYSIPEYDYATLKLCVLSILWRMSITRDEEYKRVSLGPYENDIRTMLLAKDPGSPDIFSTGWLQLTDYIGSRTAFGAASVRYKNAKIYNLGLPGFIAGVKVGRQHQPHPFQPAIMTPNRPLIVGLKENHLEDDWTPAFQKVLASQQKKRR